MSSTNPHQRTYVVTVFPEILLLARVPREYVGVIRRKLPDLKHDGLPDGDLAEYLVHGSREHVAESFAEIEEEHLAELDEVAPNGQIVVDRLLEE